ncbi:hypothetical protein [Gluconobacter japonicus]|uniref:hypothetical protein n=1 Tax=Gluconobacter japonicus TaxID=376620 RepID=UPI0039EBC0DA
MSSDNCDRFYSDYERLSLEKTAFVKVYEYALQYMSGNDRKSLATDLESICAAPIVLPGYQEALDVTLQLIRSIDEAH